MVLPPALEIFVVWHPGDAAGRDAAEQISNHFHGTTLSGLIGGAVEVFVRSEGWSSPGGAPRPIPFAASMLPNGLSAAHLIAVVPALGYELAACVESGSGGWREFVRDIAAAQTARPESVAVFPLILDQEAVRGTELGRMLGRIQTIAAPSPSGEPEAVAELRCRDLAQGIAQLASGPAARLTVFVSHTNRAGGAEENPRALLAMVRRVISDTRLQHFLDASDLQPGRDWEQELRSRAATSALLALRTDLYASREWCQREMLIAKRHGMPIVMLDSLETGEDRGSFLMDHVPRVPVRPYGDGWGSKDVRRALNVLVDECLKRSLWRIQQRLGAGTLSLAPAWWAPQAPEPVTLVQWIEDSLGSGTFDRREPAMRILHPDPPLGPDEQAVLAQIVNLSGYTGQFDLITPRMLAARSA